MPKHNNLALNDIVLDFRVVISVKDGKPILELRRATNDIRAIKTILYNAFKNAPILMLPTVSDRLRATQRLLEMGLIHQEYNDKGELEYRFTF